MFFFFSLLVRWWWSGFCLFVVRGIAFVCYSACTHLLSCYFANLFVAPSGNTYPLPPCWGYFPLFVWLSALVACSVPCIGPDHGMVSRLLLSWSLSPVGRGWVCCLKEGWDVRENAGRIIISKDGKWGWGECMELASSFPGASAASLPSRIMAILTPNGGTVAPDGSIHFTKYNTIQTYLQMWSGGLVKCACACYGRCGAPTR